MRRRAFIALLAGIAVCSFGARAQERVPIVGILALGSPDPEIFMGAFRSGLKDLGYIEGQNIRLVLRSAQGKAAELPRLADELVNLHPDVIVAFQTPAVAATSRATKDIPIVMGTGDPAVTGRVNSLAPPGG